MSTDRHISRKVGAGLVALGSVGSIVAGATLATGASATTRHASLAPLTQAIVIAYTGAAAFEGGASDSAVYPAVHDINAAGGVLGHQIVISTNDTRGDPADAVPIVDKLLATSSNLMGVYGPGTASAPTIVPIINAAKIPEIITAGNSNFDRMNYKYTWRLVAPDAANGEAMAIYAKEHHLTRVAAVFGTDTGSEGDLPGVVAGVKAAHMKLVANVALTPDQPSYRSEVERVISAHPQVIMTEEDGTTAGTFFAELKQLKGLVPVIGTSAVVVPTWLTTVRNAVSAATFQKYFTAVATAVPTTNPADKAYGAALQAEKAKVPSPASGWVSNPYSGAGYGGVISEALAMDAAHSIKPVVWNKYIFTVTEPGKGKTVVYTYAAGKAALAKGKKIQYVGPTGPIVFDKFHNAFGNEAAETLSAKDQVSIKGIITEQQIQALG